MHKYTDNVIIAVFYSTYSTYNSAVYISCVIITKTI